MYIFISLNINIFKVHFSCFKFISKQKSYAIPIGNINVAIIFKIHNEFSKEITTLYIVIIGHGIKYKII